MWYECLGKTMGISSIHSLTLCDRTVGMMRDTTELVDAWYKQAYRYRIGEKSEFDPEVLLSSFGPIQLQYRDSRNKIELTWN